jgi:hypothetical protein
MRLPFCLSLVVLAVSGCPTVDLGDSPPQPGTCRPDRAMFEDTIWPEALAPADQAMSCVTADCHAKTTGRSALRLIPDPVSDADHDQNYDVTIRFLNCGSPRSSPLITKPVAGQIAHGGGDLWTFGEAPEDLVEMWIDSAP